MLDQERVQRDPVPLVDRRREGSLRLLRALRTDDPEPVRDPVDVGVDRDGGDPVPEDEDAVRGLGADAPKARQLVERAGNHPAEPPEDLGRDLPDDPGLGMVEPRAPDQRLDGSGRGPRERGRVRIPGEQSRARDVGRLVPGPLRKDRPDENLERVLGVVAEVGRPPVPRPVERREPVQDRLPVHRRGRAHARPPRAGAGAVTPGSERSGSWSVGSRTSSPMR